MNKKYTSEELNTISRKNSNFNKKLKVGEIWKKVDKLNTKIIDIKKEYIGDELIGNILKERDELRTQFNHMKNALIFFLTKQDKPINVLDTATLEKTLNDLCVIHKISDIPKMVHNGFYEVEHGKIELNQERQLEHFKKIREGSGGL